MIEVGDVVVCSRLSFLGCLDATQQKYNQNRRCLSKMGFAGSVSSKQDDAGSGRVGARPLSIILYTPFFAPNGLIFVGGTLSGEI